MTPSDTRRRGGRSRRRRFKHRVKVRVLRHVGGSCALAVEQADPMFEPVESRQPTGLIRAVPFLLESIVCPGLRGAPIGFCHPPNEFRNFTGRCSQRNLGLVIACEPRPPADGRPVRGQSAFT
ncbi:hypothetical protein IscW_ISCW019757 [Ixodes scapularis]|uniref:Uncharacterized protein n=1 Tax=Ixodes scapularis TaxID=6945 RepID=B7PX46_IXOSC|nr:hypothetical protein IscW_ISCW019757 [Ixodes scapularis]|eukprot:XP_002410504.1 hypothetical protein IscW_ISCW019757 [Ixodes scapularis]